MSKSIYREAIDNTQILLALVSVKDLNSKKKFDMLNQIEQALEKAQKQKKLLKLYKEYYELDRMYVKNNFFLELENLNRRSEIVEQIKELEK